MVCSRDAASSPGDRRAGGLDRSLAQVEGFVSFFEKEKAAASSREGFARRFGSPDISNSRPTLTVSKNSLNTPDPGEGERKRAGSPLPSTVMEYSAMKPFSVRTIMAR